MLIGYNSSEAIKPRAVISGMQGEPNGIKTQIGWNIVGATHVESESAHTITLKVPDNIKLPSSHTNETHTMRTSCKEIVNILESDFVERRFDNQTVSQDDIRFMKILKKETRVDDDGFYKLPLPLKKERPNLPDNKIIAQKRLEQLRKKLEKKFIVYDEYKIYMNMMLDKNYAEKVPTYYGTSDISWYIPHHAVFNTNKSPNVRVVFDCSARFHDISLNECLLQSPDLLNALIVVLC